MNIVVTGTSRGIGLELVRIFLERGERVLAVARDTKSSPALQELKAKHKSALDLLDAELAEAGAEDRIANAAKEWPCVDVLVNNAGIYRTGTTAEDFMASFRINSVAPLLVTKALVAKLKKAKEPKVVQMTSLMGSIEDNTSGGSYAYRASKSALNMVNKCLMLEHREITTIVMHPGWVQTDMGGKEAPVRVRDSAAGIIKVIDGLGGKDSGAFFDFEGDRLPW